MSYVIRFSDEVASQIDAHVALASKIWYSASPTLSEIRITAGNYAGYGAYVARCQTGGLIELPVGNRSALLSRDTKNQLVHANIDHRLLLGTLLHEIGHHVVNTARRRPWEGNVHVDQSTHYTAAWVWVCCTGWNHVCDKVFDPNEFARLVKSNVQEFGPWLSRFNPYFPPTTWSREIACKHCGQAFLPKRRDARFCSGKCRVSAFRTTS